MYKPRSEHTPFNKDMDAELLSNGFEYHDDWEYGPYSSWSGQDHYVLKLMRHDFGYWLIVESHASGDNLGINIGSSNEAKEIIAVRNALENLW
jgi:hypothetical protein